MHRIPLQISLATLLLLTQCHSGGGQRTDSEEKENKESEKSKKKIELEMASERKGGVRVPKGFEAEVLKVDDGGGLGKARAVAVRENGDIHVLLSEPRDGKCLVALRDQNGDGKMDTKAYYMGYCGRGSLVIRNGYLYHSTDTSVLRTKFASDDELVPSGKTEVIAEGFEDQGQHGNKNFDIDGKGNLYVTVGAPSNACMKKMRTKGSEGQDPCPLLKKYGGVWRVSADDTGQHYMKEGSRFATGIRNMVAIRWNDAVGNLYGVQHGRDQLHQFFPDRYSKEESAKLPAEEMFKIDEGDDFGWPYCYYDGLDDQKVLAPEYGGDGDSIGRCSEYEDPIAHFPAHFAPNNLLFYQGSSFPDRYQGGAFIAFHGSWNRNEHEQWGYQVAFVPFDGAEPSGGWATFAGEFEGPERVKSPSQAEFRPCGLAQGPDGALYVVDSQVGRLWRIQKAS